MKKIKVMVVDDSAFIRMVIRDMITDYEDLEIVTTARDGLEAIKKLESIRPDVITLDIEMPNMDGIKTLEIIQKKYRIPVIMLSSLTEKNSKITLEALAKGAFDFIEKPTITASLEGIREELIKKIKSIQFINNSNEITAEGQHISNPPSIKLLPLINRKFSAIVLGTSTGGPRTITEILKGLPLNREAVPIFIVQHMPKGFTKHFADRLNNLCHLIVKEAQDGEYIQKGHIYIAPGDFHMTINGGHIALDQRSKHLGVRPAVDYLFRSAAKTYKDGLLSIILTGMGKDGTEGMKMVKEFGGMNIAQDRNTSVIFGMPGSAIKSGVVDRVLSLGEITTLLKQMING